MATELMETLVQIEPPPYDAHLPLKPKRPSKSASETTTCSSPKLQISSQASAKDRARNFCFRYGRPLGVRRMLKRRRYREQFKSFIQTAEIYIGPNKIKYRIHKDIAVTHSPFFAAALNGHFIEGETGQIILPDVEPRLFEHVVLWFYTQRLEANEHFFKDGKPTYFALLDIYALADQLCIEGMRNAIVDLMAELADLTNSVPTPMDTNALYENIRDNAPIRRLILDLFAYKKTDNLVSTHVDAWHPTFLRELICKLKRPGYSGLSRHDLRPFRPLSWNNAKACDICRAVFKPNVSGNICSSCDRAFCCACVIKAIGDGEGVIDWSAAEKECKPWSRLRARCNGYHEHMETDACELAVECVGAAGLAGATGR